MVHYDFENSEYFADLIMNIPVSKDWNLKFRTVVNMIDILIERGFHIARVTFDGWQSLNIIQQMNEKGLVSEVYSVDRGTEAYDTLISTILQKRLNYYKQVVFITELKEIQLIGNRYDHPPKGSKDVSDGVAGALSNCVKNTTHAAFKFEDIKHLFSLDYNLKNFFEVSEEGFRWIKPKIKYGIPHSVYIDGIEDSLIIVHGFQDKEDFTIDYVQTVPDFDDAKIKELAFLVTNLEANFVSVGLNTSFRVVDALRKANIRTVSGDMNRLDTVQNKGIRILRSQAREAVTSFISQVKQKNIRLVDERLVFQQISELNVAKFNQKPVAVALSMWLHYMMQDAKNRIGEGPRPIAAAGRGGFLGSSVLKPNAVQSEQPKISQKKRPRPKLRR